MNNIKILDCTLRDGGYCNNWQFGENNIKTIISGLVESGVDIIECGFINHKTEYNADVSKFTTIKHVTNFLPKTTSNKKFVLMGNYGEIDIDKVEQRTQTEIDGIRVAFHKKDCKNALLLCEAIKAKGYDVFVQAMVSLNYSDEEFLNLISQVNKINPYAFYIVDSFGVMKKNDLIRLFYLVEHNLNKEIKIGYHSHNNLQLAYSNAQALIGVQTNRDIILDSSIMGMGRGAGNLNTELIIEYLNNFEGKEYKEKPILQIIDEIINKFYQQNYWGYSLPNYLSAKHNIHPNYAKCLVEKNTLTIADMDNIFDKIDKEKCVEYDKQYIEDLYLHYMNNGVTDQEKEQFFENLIRNKEVLLIAPGKSSEEEKENIDKLIAEKGIVSISVNFLYENADYVFVSNKRRFSKIHNSILQRTIVTSNIDTTNFFVKTNYYDLLNTVDKVKDNAGLMAIKFLIRCGVKKIYLAGFDGYSYEEENNYAKKSMILITNKDEKQALNQSMNLVLKAFSKEIDLQFLTKPKHLQIIK